MRYADVPNSMRYIISLAGSGMIRCGYVPASYSAPLVLNRQR